MNRRWWIVWTLFFSTAINYINRQTLSVLAPVISREFHLNHSQLSNIFGAFQFAYAGTWLIGGIFLDIIGTRLGLSIAVVWWSLVSIVTSFAGSAFSFGVLGFLWLAVWLAVYPRSRSAGADRTTSQDVYKRQV